MASLLAFAAPAAARALPDPSLPVSAPEPRAAHPARPPRRPAVQPSRASTRPEQVTVTAVSRAVPTRQPAGETTYGADRRVFANQAAQSVADMMLTVPGVTTRDQAATEASHASMVGLRRR